MDLTMGFLLLIIGIFAGGYGTIVGAGGGFILVPALLILFNMEPALAAGSGLVIVLINSLSGVFGYAKQKRINYSVGLKLSVGALPGSIIGVCLLQFYTTDSTYFYWVFATLLISLGIFLFIKNLPEKEKEEAASTVENPLSTKLTFSWLLPLGFLMGILSSYLGIGGGWLLVPILIYFFKLPAHQATATSIFSLCLYTSIGVISQIYYDSIDWMTVIWGGIGVTLGAQLGAYISKKLPGKMIVQMLSILLIIIGFRMYF